MTELLESMPPVDFAAAYGSGALEQHGYKYDGMNPTSLPMLDLMLGVEDPAAWHADNLRRQGERARGHFSAERVALLRVGAAGRGRWHRATAGGIWRKAVLQHVGARVDGLASWAPDEVRRHLPAGPLQRLARVAVALRFGPVAQAC
ncbi:unnamed protein product [Phaeothamnion confervicola]